MIVTPRDGRTPADAAQPAARARLPRGRGLRPVGPEWPRKSLLRGGDDLFRSIYTRSGIASHEVLAVTSAVDGEGKSTVALGLAVTVAQDFPDLRVVLVEADIGRPVLANDFQLAPAVGLVTFLTGDADIEAIYRPTFLPNLRIVPAGISTSSGPRHLRSNRMAALIDRLRDDSDLVILDLPAVLSNSDSLLLTDFADGVVVVTRAGATSGGLVSEAIELLDPAKLRGVVLNGADSAVPRWVRRLAGI